MQMENVHYYILAKLIEEDKEADKDYTTSGIYERFSKDPALYASIDTLSQDIDFIRRNFLTPLDTRYGENFTRYVIPQLTRDSIEIAKKEREKQERTEILERRILSSTLNTNTFIMLSVGLSFLALIVQGFSTCSQREQTSLQRKQYQLDSLQLEILKQQDSKSFPDSLLLVIPKTTSKTDSVVIKILK